MKSQFFFALLLLLPILSVLGQSGANSGQIVGQILDPSAGAAAGSRVEVRNKDTNSTRGAITDSAGRYAVSDLSLGPYEVSVNTSGFQAPVRDAFLTLGSSVTVNFNLALAGKTESVEVTNGAPGIEPTRSATKSILTDLQI